MSPSRVKNAIWLMRATRSTSCEAVSRHLHRDGAEIILLADFDPTVSQNRVGGREMKIDVGQHEMIEVVVALHFSLVGGPERKRDLPIGAGIDRLCVERFDESDSS